MVEVQEVLGVQVLEEVQAVVDLQHHQEQEDLLVSLVVQPVQPVEQVLAKEPLLLELVLQVELPLQLVQDLHKLYQIVEHRHHLEQIKWVSLNFPIF